MRLLDHLLRAKGSARQILRLPTEGPAVLADAQELARPEVVRGIQFSAFTFATAKLGLNFVECEFARCRFCDLTSEGHGWGARDRWSDCSFERCDLRDMIAPVNTFTDCRFDHVDLKTFKPHQTLFDRCSFSQSTVVGLRAKLISNSQIVNRDFGSGGGQLLFRDCQFAGVSFQRCYFAGVVFQRCAFERTSAEACDFVDVTSDVQWWSPQSSDPFSVFLHQALELIRSKCGSGSAAYREFEAYVEAYRSGQTTSDDFSACLYTDRVPDAELRKISDGLIELARRFPF